MESPVALGTTKQTTVTEGVQKRGGVCQHQGEMLCVIHTVDIPVG